MVWNVAMTQITVSAEIALAIAQSTLPIVLVDPQGRTLGQMTMVNDSSVVEATHAEEDEWAEAKRRMEQAKREGGKFYTTKEVLEHLKSLERE
jgi:hypothetical protein